MSFEIIDLSHPIDETMPVYPGDLIPKLKTITTIKKHNYRESKLILNTHTWTHVDSPAHIIDDGPTIDSFPPEKYFGYGKVLDCNQKSIITIDIIRQALSSSHPDFVLIYTGWDTYWGTDTYYRNIPVLDSEVIEYLTSLSIKGVGIDTPSIDPVGSENLSNHKALLSDNIILIENLTGLGHLLEKRFIFSCFPLKLNNADGSPVRATAIIQDK